MEPKQGFGSEEREETSVRYQETLNCSGMMMDSGVGRNHSFLKEQNTHIFVPKQPKDTNGWHPDAQQDAKNDKASLSQNQFGSSPQNIYTIAPESEGQPEEAATQHTYQNGATQQSRLRPGSEIYAR